MSKTEIFVLLLCVVAIVFSFLLLLRLQASLCLSHPVDLDHPYSSEKYTCLAFTL